MSHEASSNESANSANSALGLECRLCPPLFGHLNKSHYTLFVQLELTAHSYPVSTLGVWIVVRETWILCLSVPFSNPEDRVEGCRWMCST